MVVHLHLGRPHLAEQFPAFLFERAHAGLAIQGVRHRAEVGVHQLRGKAQIDVRLRYDDVVKRLVDHGQTPHVGLDACGVMLHAGLQLLQVAAQPVGLLAGGHIVVEHPQSRHGESERLAAARGRSVGTHGPLQRGAKTVCYLGDQHATLVLYLAILQLYLPQHLVHVEKFHLVEIEEFGRHHLDGVSVEVYEPERILAVGSLDVAAQRGKVADIGANAVAGIAVGLHQFRISVEHHRGLASHLFHAARPCQPVRRLRRALGQGGAQVEGYHALQLVQGVFRRLQFVLGYSQRVAHVSLLKTMVQLVVGHDRRARIVRHESDADIAVVAVEAIRVIDQAPHLGRVARDAILL